VPQTVTDWFRLTHDTAHGEWTDAKDSGIREDTPTTNWGGNLSLLVDGVTSSVRRSLVSFVVPPHSTKGALPVAGMRLHFYAHSGTIGNVTVRMHTLADTWSESDQTGGTNAEGADWNTRDGVTAWTTAVGAVNVGIKIAQATFNPGGAPGWVEFQFDTYVVDAAIVVDDVVNLRLSQSNETGGNTASFYSMESTTNAASWPTGAPAWPAGGPDDYRPVLEVIYSDTAPAPIADFASAPSDNPALAEFVWTPSEETDVRQYAIRYDTTSPLVGTDSFVDLDGWGAADITAPGTSKAKMAAGATFAENTRYFVNIWAEDESNTDANATPSPEVVVIRPDLGTITNATTGTVPRPFNFADLSEAPTAFGVGDKIVMAAAGLGDRLTASALVLDPPRIDVDWADGTEVTEYVPKVGRITSNVSSTDTTIEVDQPAKFTPGIDVVLITNGTNYDVGRVTGLAAGGITIDTDLAAYSEGVRYAYTASASTIYTLPTHIVTRHDAAWAPRARILNAHGFASDWTAVTGSPVIATLAPIAVIDTNIKAPITTDTARFSGGRSYNRNAARPITSYRWSIDNAGTAGDPDVADSTTTNPYTTHNHGGAGTCRVALQVYDGTTASSTANAWNDASNPNAAVSVTVAAESSFAMTSLANPYRTFTWKFRNGARVGIVDGIDVRERVILGDGLSYMVVTYTGTAHTGGSDQVPADISTLEDVFVSKKSITDNVPLAAGGDVSASGHASNFEARKLGGGDDGQWEWSLTVVFDAMS